MFLGELQSLAQPSDLGVARIGVFAPGVVGKHQHLQVNTFSAVGILQHLDVAVGVAERGDRATADVLIDHVRVLTTGLLAPGLGQPVQHYLR